MTTARNVFRGCWAPLGFESLLLQRRWLLFDSGASRIAMHFFFQMTLAEELVRPRLEFSSWKMPAHFWCWGWWRWWECFYRKETSFDSGFVAFFNASKTVLGWIIAAQNAGLWKERDILRTHTPSLRLFIHRCISQLHFNYSCWKKKQQENTSKKNTIVLFLHFSFLTS